MSSLHQVFDESIYERLKGMAPKAVFFIIERLQSNNHIAWLAGGAVRDLVLGRTPKDYDVVTNATPDQVQQLFEKTQSLGKQFGIIHVHQEDSIIEVASFRSDQAYVDGRRPIGVVLSRPEDDAWRRDFTINALFYDLNSKQIIDYVGGLRDLEKHQVKAVGIAKDRFSEDHLRLLRALRFASTLGFSIDQDTLQALLENKEKIIQVSHERIRSELEKVIPAAVAFADQLKAYGLVGILFPCFFREPALKKENPVAIFKDPKTLSELLFYFFERFTDGVEIDAKQMQAISNFYKLSRAEKENFNWALQFKKILNEKKDNLETRLFIYKTSEFSSHFQDWYSQWKSLESIVGSVDFNMKAQFLIARDCKELQGPRLGEFLNQLKESQLMGEIQNRSEALAFYKNFLERKR